MNTRVVVTGMGFVTPLGNSLEDLWSRINNGDSAARAYDDLLQQGFRSTVACRVDGFDSISYTRGIEQAIFAIQNAITQAGISLPKYRTGVFVGSTLGESLVFEKFAEGENVSPENSTCASFAREICQKLDINGIRRAYGTACSAGNYAISSGALLLKNNSIDVAIAGGVDPFSRIAMAGFSRSRAMSTDGFCKPFDKTRTGMLLGEGAAFFILEREENALRRNGKPLAIIGETGFSCDAYHQTSPNPDGKEMEMAMIKALKKQKIQVKDLGWICAHGSGTIVSDKTEALAIKRLSGENVIPVSGFKGAIGHALGAATAIEAAIIIMSLEKQVIPPTANFGQLDPGMDILVVRESKEKPVDWVMNCGYAFGGLNSALLLGKWK